MARSASETAASRFTALMKDALKSYLFDGILLILLGLVLLIFPDTSLSTFCMVAGVVLAIMGLVKIIFFAANLGGVRRGVDIPIGLAQIALGVALIVKPGFFISLFQIVVGVILVYGSLLMVTRAFRLREVRGPLFTLSIVFGVLTLVLGVVILVNPAQTAAFIVQLMGAALVVEGLSLVIVMHSAKKNVKAVEDALEDLENREIVVVPERVESLGRNGGEGVGAGAGAGVGAGAESGSHDRGGRTEYYGR